MKDAIAKAITEAPERAVYEPPLFDLAHKVAEQRRAGRSRSRRRKYVGE